MNVNKLFNKVILNVIIVDLEYKGKYKIMLNNFYIYVLYLCIYVFVIIMVIIVNKFINSNLVFYVILILNILILGSMFIFVRVYVYNIEL